MQFSDVQTSSTHTITTKDKTKYFNSLIKNMDHSIGFVVEDKKLIGLPFDSLTNWTVLNNEFIRFYGLTYIEICMNSNIISPCQIYYPE